MPIYWLGIDVYPTSVSSVTLTGPPEKAAVFIDSITIAGCILTAGEIGEIHVFFFWCSKNLGFDQQTHVWIFLGGKPSVDFFG